MTKTETTETKNKKLLRKAYTAWHKTKGDYKVWMDLLADEIDFGSLADGKEGMEFTKHCRSKKQVLGYFEGLVADWSMEFYRIDEYVAQGTRIVAIGECAWKNRRNGNRICVPKVDVWTIKRGKATSFMEYYDTYSVLEASRG